MPALGKNGNGEAASLDVFKFRKCMNLLRSDRAGEADTARIKALDLCDVAGLPWEEGLKLAYGGDDGRAAELEADNEALRQKLAQREADAAALVDGYEEKIAALRGDLEAAQAGGKVRESAGGDEPFSGGLVALVVFVASILVLWAALR
jgi:hypothetical protein